MKSLMLETTRYDVLRDASPEPWKTHMKDRIKGYTLSLTDVQMSEKDRRCVVCFKLLPPAGHTDQWVYISLEDFWDIYDENESSEKPMSLSSILNLVIMHGNIKVFCTCPSWLYGGYKYMATELDYAYGSYETRYPKIKNPKLKGTLCKHAYVAVKGLPHQKFGISSRISRWLKQHPRKEDKDGKD